MDLRTPGHAFRFLHHPRRDILVFLNPTSRTLPDDHFIGVATAILDRLLHHSHVITIRGDSYLQKAAAAPAATAST